MLRNIALALGLGLVAWTGNSVEQLKISMAEVKVEIAHLKNPTIEGKQYVQLTP